METHASMHTIKNRKKELKQQINRFIPIYRISKYIYICIQQKSSQANTQKHTHTFISKIDVKLYIGNE